MITPRILLNLICVLLAHASTTQATETLDRLFTTKSQREMLNQLRVNQGVIKVTNPTIQGYVKRSDGISTWWLNQQPTPQKPQPTLKNAPTE